MPPVGVAEAARERPADGRPRRILTAAVVGAGAVAKQHLACLRALECSELAAVCDLSAAVAESAAARYGVPAWFTDHRELLDRVAPDVVHVATPPASHHAIAADALEAGAGVLVEKPLVADPRQLEPLLGLAEQRGLLLVEDYNYVFNPQVVEMRRRLADGSLGRLAHVEVDLALDILGADSPFADPNLAHPAAALPGGAVADFLPHLASLVHFLAGPHQRVRAVWSARGRHPRVEYDDLRALVEAERATASISFSATSQPDGFWLRVHGSRMRMEANLFEPRLTVERLRAAPRPLFPVLNGAAEIAAVGRAAAGGLWDKLRGAPGAYSGLWRLVALTHDAIARAAPAPVALADVRAVNGLVAALVAEQRRA